ncbi:sacsin N-terminal ATP-binding-like domain-containing protein [Jongsikchunia kroppenstedtii]|uniref:sacsin N-terminal ATP-binding-like domain-containing protein n=1 Tax=Jongsikchunia kroppenstedtii TaxID=1121721 RepID=UPI00037610CC|nr:hypothetical protein [Jongsikchunia kroppenstedtii]
MSVDQRSADPFDTQAIRRSTLDSWRSSPSRYIEDAAAEQDLVHIGYRDRLATELVANAADAAVAGGSVGEVAVWLTTATAPGSAEIHVANTGAPLDAAGVAALSSLRASAKAGSGGGSVGRFGVGFTVAATVADRVDIRSRCGGITFDRRATEQAIVDDGIDRPANPPLLRLPWPADTEPAVGFDTEVVLHLQADTDPERVIAGFVDAAVDLLLELPALGTITVTGQRFTRTETPHGAMTLVEIGDRQWLRYAAPHARWLAEIDSDGRVIRSTGDRLRAPTETDIELTIPVRCITDLPTTPDRRGLDPDADIATAAAGYAQFVEALPETDRLAAVPDAGFGANPYDVQLRDALIAELADGTWLPSAAGPESEVLLLVPSRSVVLADLTPDLAAVIGPVIGQLVTPDFSGRQSIQTLTRLGVQRIGLADIAERLTGIDRDPTWWRGLYEALTAVATTPEDFAELGALPVPRADGRVMPGARGLAVIDGIDVPVPWVQTVEPAAVHPLVLRIGAVSMSVVEALSDPALRTAIADSDSSELAEQVLDVIASYLAQADGPLELPEWLGGLLIPDADGELVPADELLLADGPLGRVLVDDSPFAAPSADWVRGFGVDAMRAIGVGWGFTVVREQYPTGPDHDLPDEESWWATLADDPAELVVVRDLDLVDPARWGQALTLLAEDPVIAPLLGDRRGYTAWWLRHFAAVGGRPLGHYRRGDDMSLAGVLDPLDHPQAPQLTGVLAAREVDDADAARMLLAHLVDSDRAPSAVVVAGVHAALAAAVGRGVIGPEDIDPPAVVRTLAGLGDADRAVVIDQPWYLPVVEAERAVLLAPPYEPADAMALAGLLDIDLASEAIDAEPVDPGTPTRWSDHPRALAATVLLQIPLPDGELRLHDSLAVRVRRSGADNDSAQVVEVDWWVDEAGISHLTDRWRVPR